MSYYHGQWNSKNKFVSFGSYVFSMDKRHTLCTVAVTACRIRLFVFVKISPTKTLTNRMSAVLISETKLILRTEKATSKNCSGNGNKISEESKPITAMITVNRISKNC